ncbi:DNA polymerase III subunit delta' [Gordonia paraffinivorans]|uniref:GlcG/HbpS family heme-binding protein n=1 Tax=Gordonia paraffinivorans TaxID=175628 RepID=UPI000D61ED90|nr:heme-binding protein [Gordonia paraffinivorans]MBY4573076.1 DNA polymerase III subunit delta' [Gordonia paraffinivorans]PWD42090.1 DNA polymerase III subunit delta' [Gordonia paraffinivorans]
MLQISRIDLAEARALIDAATERSLEIGVPMCIAVVDESGYLVAFDRMDTAKITSVSIAIDKAFTAAGARNHTSFYARVSAPGAPAWGINQTNDGHFNVIPGGIPIVVDGNVIGGIGISGGNSAQDDDVAAHAVNRAGVGEPVEVPAATAGAH